MGEGGGVGNALTGCGQSLGLLYNLPTCTSSSDTPKPGPAAPLMLLQVESLLRSCETSTKRWLLPSWPGRVKEKNIKEETQRPDAGQCKPALRGVMLVLCLGQGRRGFDHKNPLLKFTEDLRGRKQNKIKAVLSLSTFQKESHCDCAERDRGGKEGRPSAFLMQHL